MRGDCEDYADVHVDIFKILRTEELYVQRWETLSQRRVYGGKLK